MIVGFVLVLPSSVAPAPLWAQAPSVRDSAGVRIVHNAPRATAAIAFKLGASALMDIGGLQDNPDDEFQPGTFLDVARLSDGRLAVVDKVRVQYFTSGGKRLLMVGRGGRGPGEFSQLSSACRTRGDTVVVSDRANRRTTVLDHAGVIVRSIPQDTYGSPGVGSCFDDGTFLVANTLPAPSGNARQVRLTRLRLDGSVANVIGEFSAGIADMVTQRQTTAIAWGQWAYFGDASASRIHVLSAAGALTSIIRSDDPPPPVTDTELEQFARMNVRDNASAAESLAQRDRTRSAPHAATWPSFRRFLVDQAGRLWVEDYTKIFDFVTPDIWTAFDPSGRVLGRLVIPAPAPRQPRMRVISFGTDNVLVQRADADGAAHLTLYPLLRVNQ